MKEKATQEYKRRLRMVQKSKLNGRNKIRAINAWVVAIFRYRAGILHWNKSELNALDRKSRTTVTMYGALHPKSDVDRLYMKRKEGGRGLIGVEQKKKIVWVSVANSGEKLIRGGAAARTIRIERIITSGEFKKQREQELKQKWNGKRMLGQSVREMPEKVNKNKTWQWLSKSDSKITTEALLSAAQGQASRTNYVKYHIDRTCESPLCRLCGKRGEGVQHLVSGCEKLAQKEYKRRRDNVAKKGDWDLCKKNELDCKENGMNTCQKEQ